MSAVTTWRTTADARAQDVKNREQVNAQITWSNELARIEANTKDINGNLKVPSL